MRINQVLIIIFVLNILDALETYFFISLGYAEESNMVLLGLINVFGLFHALMIKVIVVSFFLMILFLVDKLSKIYVLRLFYFIVAVGYCLGLFVVVLWNLSILIYGMSF